MSFMTALSDRVMILHHGKKLYEGDVKGLFRNEEVIDAYLGLGAAADADEVADRASAGGVMT